MYYPAIGGQNLEPEKPYYSFPIMLLKAQNLDY
jgi:hypothetical protein